MKVAINPNGMIAENAIAHQAADVVTTGCPPTCVATRIKRKTSRDIARDRVPMTVVALPLPTNGKLKRTPAKGLV